MDALDKDTITKWVAPPADEKYVPPVMGRPTKYHPGMCAFVIERMKEGYGQKEVALALDVSIDTINEWKKVKKDFSAAMNKGRLYCQAWWEAKGRVNIEKSQFNTALWFINMKNRFPSEWRDKHEIEHTGDVHVEIVQFTDKDE